MKQFSWMILIVLTQTGCFEGPGIGQQSKSSGIVQVDGQTSDEGVTTGSISSGSGVAQTLTASSEAISGASVTFQPGSLALDLDVSLEEGTSIASDKVASSLGVEGSEVSSASNALVISGSESIDASSPFTLELPLSSTGLRLTNDSQYLVIFYRVRKQSSNGEVFDGIIPTNQIRVENGKASFETTFFGSFQAAYINIEVTEEKSQKTDKPILAKKEENKLQAIVWNSVTAQFSDETLVTTTDVSGFQGAVSCLFQLDNDKKAPWAIVCQNLTDTNVQVGDNGLNPEEYCTEAQTNDDSDTNGPTEVFVRFICEDESGRTSISPWSNGFDAPNDSGNSNDNNGNDWPEILSVTQLEIGGRHLELSWEIEEDSSSNIGGAYFVYATGSDVPSNCNTQNFSHFVINDVEADSLGNGRVRYEYKMFGFEPNTTYQYRLCLANQDGTDDSPGTTGTLTTIGDALTCDSGDLNSVCTITTSKTIGDGAIISGGGDLVVESAGIIQNAVSTEDLGFAMGGDIKVRNGGQINANIFHMEAENIYFGEGGTNAVVSADEKGFAGGGMMQMGDAPDTQFKAKYDAVSAAGAGGTHGGLGYLPGFEGLAYGSFVYPENAGGGGAGGGSASGGNGGGYIVIEARDKFSIDGSSSLTANGGNGTAGSGSGAGGSILIEAYEFEYSGGSTIRANGGDDTGSGNSAGGGRIAIHFETSSNPMFADSLTSQFNAAGGSNATTIYSGGAGTIFIVNRASPEDQSLLIIDNKDIATGNPSGPNFDFGAATPIDILDDVGFEIETIKVRSGGNVSFIAPGMDWANTAQQLQVKNLHLAERDGTFGAGYATATASINTAGGGATMDGNGDGPGNYNNSVGGGAAHAAVGGAGLDAGATSSSLYGSLDAPITPGVEMTEGSGGAGDGIGKGGDGGGRMYFEASNEVFIGGIVYANGHDGASTDAGGGSGGFIFIKSDDFEIGPNGYVKSEGGSSPSTGGGGAGGYIHLDFTTTSNSAIDFNARVIVTGGGGANAGSNGQRKCMHNGANDC